MPKVSIIIPNWNRKDDLMECLESINKQSVKDYEVVVVDNGSTDGSVEILKRQYPFVKIIENKENVGAAQARNQAIKIAKGEYLWFLDSDAVVIKKDCLFNMLSILNQDKKIGLLGGEVLKINDKYKIRVSNSCRNQDGIFLYLEGCKLKQTDYIATSNCIVRREIICRIGGFDPHYIYGYEDNNVGYNISRLGYKNIVDDRVLAYHKIAISGRMSNFYMWHRNRIRFLILKENLWFLLFLPFIDIYTTLKIFPSRLKEVKERGIKDLALMKTKKQRRGGTFYKIFVLGFDYSLNWILGMLWNVINLPKTIYIRKKRPNFIK